MTKLTSISVEKPWGRTKLPAPFETSFDKRIGEIWFPSPPGSNLPLVKYLFTSDNLSIQVHPADEDARQRGLSSGKEECWYILDADPGACLGIGTVRPLSAAELREAAISGEIEALMEWHPVQAGMFFHIPPGTVHAIGAGISLIEVQQDSDATYRLFDYGRPRELHLNDGISVACAKPFPRAQQKAVSPAQSEILLETPHFTILHIVNGDDEMWRRMGGRSLITLLSGSATISGIFLLPGDCYATQPGERIAWAQPCRALIANAATSKIMCDV